MSGRTIITIGRQNGSAGREIGQKLAERLGVAFYDRELLKEAALASGISAELFEMNDEKPVNSLLYTLSMHPYAGGTLAGPDTMPLAQKVFLAQFDTIRRIAQREDCVIVGRCADYALRDQPDCINLFIHAPLADRIARIRTRQQLSDAQAKEQAIKIDKKRAAYYNSYSDHKWGALESYHLTIDSSVLGIEKTADLLHMFAQNR